ncbi:MAG: DUF6754 domain-containing protein [Phycisphaerales bacterium]
MAIIPSLLLAQAAAATSAPPAPFFIVGKGLLAVVLMVVAAAVLGCIQWARSGGRVHVRRIAGLDAVEEAVGRATEMGRPMLFIPGLQDMDNIQTVAGITVLSRVATVAAGYDADLEVPTARSLVMTSAREAVQAAYMGAGRSDSFNPDRVYYVSDEQFAYVAHVGGIMVRRRPAACFYFGCFFGESLMLAENGNAIGAIQIAGTAETTQLPFFVAACDYTLIGEEFFAATAYLSGEPDQMGTLLGQDVVKALAWAAMLGAAALGTLAAVTHSKALLDLVDSIRGAMGGGA